MKASGHYSRRRQCNYCVHDFLSQCIYKLEPKFKEHLITAISIIDRNNEMVENQTNKARNEGSEALSRITQMVGKQSE